MKKIKNMKSEIKRQEVAVNLFDRRLFNTQFTLAQAIKLDAENMAQNLISGINRKIAISPHRHCQ